MFATVQARWRIRIAHCQAGAGHGSQRLQIPFEPFFSHRLSARRREQIQGAARAATGWQ